MKKFLLVLLALVMAVGLAMAESDSKPMPAEAAGFEGVWQCGRATAELVWEEEGFRVLISWGSSASETTEWQYSCYYHEDDNTLVSMPFGIKTDLVYGEGGEVTSSNVLYEDGQATFKIDEDGHLIWIDEKGNAGDGMLFERLDSIIGIGTDTDEIPSSSLYTPAVPETFKALVSGKTFEARIDGKNCYGEDEDARYTITLTVCEETHYEADIANLKVNDIVAFGPDSAVMAMEVASDEYGFSIKDGNHDGYSFTRADDGCYTVRTETDNILYTDVFTITVPLDKDISFLDWSDPENTEAPVKKGYDEFLSLMLEGTNFAPYNTKVTFDGNGKLVEILYTYSPFN